MDSFFVNALVQASLCRAHSWWRKANSSDPPSRTPSREPRGYTVPTIWDENWAGVKVYSSWTPRKYRVASLLRNSGGYINLDRIKSKEWRPVDYRSYREMTVPPKYLNSLQSIVVGGTTPDPDDDPVRRFLPKKRLVMAEKRSYYSGQSVGAKFSEDMEELRWLFQIALRDPNVSTEMLFNIYTQFPEEDAVRGSRMRFLTRQMLELLLARFMSSEDLDEVSMLRYMVLLGDMKACNISITRREWNKAMTFVARSYKYVSTAEVNAVVDLWHESERCCATPSDTTTFNVLIDAAIRNSDFRRVETFLQEMISRGLEPDRYTLTMIMILHGRKRDEAEIIDTYKRMVVRGEVIDTVVLNALISALINARKLVSAERIYNFMVLMGPEGEKEPFSHLSYTEQHRHTGKLYKNLARLQKYTKQLKVPLRPNMGTFHTMLGAYARKGEWAGCQIILEEMEYFGIPKSATTYHLLLRGFFHYSRFRNTQWHGGRLRQLLLEVLDEHWDDIVWGKVLAVWVIRAVARTYRDRESVQSIWETVVRRWEAQGGKIHRGALLVLEHELRMLGHPGRRTGWPPPPIYDDKGKPLSLMRRAFGLY